MLKYTYVDSVDEAADPLIIMRRVEGARGGIVLESGALYIWL